MDNMKERIEEKKEAFDPVAAKDSINKAGKKKKNRREKDTIRKITRECMKDWRSVDFDEEEVIS